MDSRKVNLKILTPCFCAGAEQSRAELRAPSVRGQLRWWFRVLGGTPEQEKSLFGGVHKLPSETDDDEHTAASKVIVRVRVLEQLYGQPQDLPRQNCPGYYLFHFANASNKPKGAANGPRYQKEAWFAPDTSFEVSVAFRITLTQVEKELFDKTWQAFLMLGSLGLRQTRGLGAFSPDSPPAPQEVKKVLGQLADCQVPSWIVTPEIGDAFLGDWLEALIRLEATVGYFRQHGFSAGRTGGNATPLGTSSPRQASALHLRPIRTTQGILPVVFLAPQTLANWKETRLAEFNQAINNAKDIRYPYMQQIPNPDTRKSLALTPSNQF
ncbi:MAG: type III-B CRISPR module RAMP protein Cmr1 [Kiritimatiellae bacterium]|nr:type III-B CRISPR module RAMP protein Cmr1 [Kiritimatiellia bacterium]